MKARLFTAFVLAVGLALLMPSGGQLLTAQSQPVAPVAPALSPGGGSKVLGRGPTFTHIH